MLIYGQYIYKRIPFTIDFFVKPYNGKQYNIFLYYFKGEINLHETLYYELLGLCIYDVYNKPDPIIKLYDATNPLFLSWPLLVQFKHTNNI